MDLSIDFYSNFSSYKDCSPPGVLLPKISIPAKKFTSLNLKKGEASNFDFLSHLCNSNLNKFKKLFYFMQLTGSEKLVFIASFMVLMNWGVRVSESIITHVIEQSLCSCSQ